MRAGTLGLAAAFLAAAPAAASEPLADAVLGVLLALEPPGRSASSLVVVPEGSPPACPDRYRPVCAKPRRDVWHGGAWVRPETPEEGRARYRVIAEAIVDVTAGDRERASQLVTTVRHESRLRRDVHSGIGPDAIGDVGRAFCLVQALGHKDDAKGTFAAPEIPAYKLLGTSPEATRRCLSVGLRELERIGGTPEDKFRGYVGAKSKDDKRVTARVATHERVSAMLAEALTPQGGRKAAAR